MNYSVSDLISISNGSHLCGPKNNSITSFSIDSRRIWSKNSIAFIALNGINFNGHDFIQIAYDKGVRVFIVSEPRDFYSELKHADFVQVEHCVDAIQKIAVDHRSKFSFPLIGITGSNGKTIVKEWLSQCIDEKYKVVKTPKSYNSQIGVPLSIFEIKKDHNLGIFEAGISRPGEMEKLANILRPDIGIFTNIGNAHAEFFNSEEEKALEKIKLFYSCKKTIFCADIKTVSVAVQKLKSETLSWSRNGKGDINFSISNLAKGSVKASSQKGDFIIPFDDDVSIQNCLHVITAMILLGFSETEINEKIKELSQVRMRLENVEGQYNSIYINDVYNSDLNSFEAAVELLKKEKTKDEKHLILSEIKNTGFSPNQIAQIISKQVLDLPLASIHLIGKNAKAYSSAFTGNIKYYESTNKFLEQIHANNFKNSAVLVKGSRLFRLERITRKFQKKTHKTVLEVNLSQIQENLNFYRSKLKPETELIVMVKAFSYGSGSHEIAQVLENNNVDYLAVAYVDEGLALRDKNIQIPIMVMNPEDPEVETLISSNLHPVIYSFESLEHYRPFAKDIQIHIKIDTGMHRLGFAMNELECLSSLLQESDFNVLSVFTHLAASGEKEHDAFTIQQLELFKEAQKKLGLKNVKYHALNTSGISRFPESQFDMVRLGIGLYGASQIRSERAFLKPAVRLISSISQIKKVLKEESVGYSRGFIADKDLTIGIIPIGYADGIHRCFGNGNGSVYINGDFVKTVGNICMDMCMVDLTETHCKVGDEVEFFGERKDIEKTAEEMKTISYEVLASVSQRVKRVFYFD